MPTDKHLYDAIDNNDLDQVKCLIESEDPLSYAHAYDYSSPCLQATERGHIEILHYLLEKDYCFVDEGIENTCYSPLMAACENGYAEIAKMLIQHGADINRQFEKEYEQGFALTLAIENGHTNIVKLLLDQGANTECVKWSYDGIGNFRETPFLLAMQHNHTEDMKLLLEYGADVDGECVISSEAHTPLSYSVARNKTEWIQFLLIHGADVHKIVEDGFSVAEYAERLGRLELLVPAEHEYSK